MSQPRRGFVGLSQSSRWLSSWLAVVGVVAAVQPASAAAADKSALVPGRLSLPKGPGSIEGLGENVEPNLSMGQASYRVPVALPAA